MRERIGIVFAMAGLLALTAGSQAAAAQFVGQRALTKIDQPWAGGTTPAPATGGKVVFSDDFASSEQWGTATDKDKSIEYDDGALRIIVYTKNYFVWSTPNDTTYRDLHMETTVLNNGTDATTAVGFMCAQQDAKNDFYYLAMTPAGEYAIAKAVDGETDVFLTNNDRWAKSDLITKNASSYRVGADCGQGRLTLYVDGNEIATVNDRTYTSGIVGVIVWSGEKATKTDVSFDDFEITEMP